MYLKKRSYKNWIRWQCNRQRTAGCMGGLTTDDTYENPRSHVNHNHPADRTGVEVTKLCTTMKAVAKQSRSRPNQILTQALLEASDEVCANIGKIQTCKRDLQHQRRGCLPNDPATLPELVIPDEWTLTSGADRRLFLIHDSGPGQRQRVVVYAAEGQLRHLGQSDTWFMDGNYAMSPGARRDGGVSRLLRFRVCNWNLSSCSTRTSAAWSSSTTTTRPEHSTTVRHTHLECASCHSGGTGSDEQRL